MAGKYKLPQISLICADQRNLREIKKLSKVPNDEVSRRYGLDADIHRRHATQRKMSNVTQLVTKKLSA